MAVFRIERTRDYTVMSNHHLRNHELSLKAKGLLSMMLSLPDDWNYTTRGLAKICKEGVDAIGNALRELETAGYMKPPVTLCATSCGTGRAGSATPSMSFMNSPSPGSRKRLGRIRMYQIRLHQIRKTRIWINRIRKSPQN